MVRESDIIHTITQMETRYWSDILQAEMDFNTVQKGIRSGDFTLIDVRNVNEVQTAGKIPSSHLIPRKY